VTAPPALASLWRRALAYGADALLLSAAFWVVVLGLELAGLGSGRNLRPVVTVAAVPYFVAGWMRGATPGMRLLGVRVIAADGGGVDFGRAVTRYLGMMLAALPFGLGFAWAVLDRRRQGWHDRIAGTLVVRG
jgi:uncharacterized RDD family membrane protein YckC